MIPFQVEIDPKDIDDLRERLLRTRWQEPATVEDWSQGVPLDYARDVVTYWVHGYDMNRVADRMNAHEQHLVELDGLPFTSCTRVRRIRRRVRS